MILDVFQNNILFHSTLCDAKLDDATFCDVRVVVVVVVVVVVYIM